jgi:uncharacterized membrane protein YcaP (DUF421 family)
LRVNPIGDIDVHFAMQEAYHLISILGRSVAVYVCIVLLLRLFGKKELAQLSVVHLVFILLNSNSVQNMMVGSNSFNSSLKLYPNAALA